MEMSQIEKAKYYMISLCGIKKKSKQMNNKLKQNQIPRNKEQSDGCWGEGLVGNAGVGGEG